MKILGILQARMGSQRLPCKVLREINSKPMLWYCINRIKKSNLLSHLVVATSTNKENDKIEDFCFKNNIDCFRGEEDDVLDRFLKCSEKYNADIILRFTADCPLIDFRIIDDMIVDFQNNKYDYLKNTWFINSYPSGFDVEIFNFDTLKKHSVIEKNIKNREHVLNTLDPKIFKKGKYYFGSFSDKIDTNKIHLSVDTYEDFQVVEKILNNFDNTDFSFEDVVFYLNDNPEIPKINVDELKEKFILKIKLEN